MSFSILAVRWTRVLGQHYNQLKFTQRYTVSEQASRGAPTRIDQWGKGGKRGALIVKAVHTGLVEILRELDGSLGINLQFFYTTGTCVLQCVLLWTTIVVTSRGWWLTHYESMPGLGYPYVYLPCLYHAVPMCPDKIIKVVHRSKQS